MLEASKVSSGGHSDEAIDEVLSADCPTFDELEDFIDRSFQNANILTIIIPTYSPPDLLIALPHLGRKMKHYSEAISHVQG